MIRNLTRKTILAREKQLLRSGLSKAMGLMFARRLRGRGLVMVFNRERMISLHMLMVFFPIDVLWLDRNKRAVDMKESFKPFRVVLPKKAAQYIIELPEGAIRKSKTEVGDRIGF